MRRTNHKVMIALAGFALVGSSGLVLAAAARTPAETIQYRQQQLKNLGGAFKAISDETKAPTPNLDTIRTNVKTVQKLAAEFPTWFPAGSGPESGVKTAAKPEIWTNAAGFQDKLKGLQAGVQDLATASAGSDTAAIAAAVRAVGPRCGACHADFRVRQAPPPAPPSPPAT